MPVRNRKTSPRPPKVANLAGRYGKIGISAVEAAARYGHSREIQGSLHPTRAPGDTRGASGERRKQAKP
jgi:hypothetical protein